MKHSDAPVSVLFMSVMAMFSRACRKQWRCQRRCAGRLARVRALHSLRRKQVLVVSQGALSARRCVEMYA